MLSEKNRALVERVAPSRAEQSIARLYPELLNRLLDAAYAAGRAEVWEKVEPALEPFANQFGDDFPRPDEWHFAGGLYLRDFRRAAEVYDKLTASDPT